MRQSRTAARPVIAFMIIAVIALVIAFVAPPVARIAIALIALPITIMIVCAPTSAPKRKLPQG